MHLYGGAADIEPLVELASQRGLVLIEDNAQSLGAALGGKKLGSFGAVAATSFYPSKNLGAYGDAGMIFTDSRRDRGTRREAAEPWPNRPLCQCRTRLE